MLSIGSPLVALWLSLTLFMPPWAAAQDPAGRPPLDSSQAVPAKSEVINAWQARQDRIRTFQFAWTEEQTYPKGWLPNPRYPERERSAIPALHTDRAYTVSKSLLVDGNRMRYAFELDRKEEPDGVGVVAPTPGNNQGLGVGRHYSYISVLDGLRGEIRLSSLTGTPPATVREVESNVDAQNLDVRVIMMALRPLDPVMGHLLINRAVTNERRTLYKGRSTFLLEERHDPSGWKTIVWVEPERDFLVSRYALFFEQKRIVDIDIDYTHDTRWGWLPRGWRVTQMLADGSMRLVTEAHVSTYSINQSVRIEEFK